MHTGAKVIIGDKYAHACSYGPAVGQKATIREIYNEINPYRLQGRHTICFVEMENGQTWEIHIDDCLPVSNKAYKNVLIRVED